MGRALVTLFCACALVGCGARERDGVTLENATGKDDGRRDLPVVVPRGGGVNATFDCVEGFLDRCNIVVTLGQLSMRGLIVGEARLGSVALDAPDGRELWREAIVATEDDARTKHLTPAAFAVDDWAHGTYTVRLDNVTALPFELRLAAAWE